MRGILVSCFSIVVFLCTTVVQADVYSWTDENGVRRFSNTEPDPMAEDMEIHQEIATGAESGELDRPDDGASIAPPPGWNEEFDRHEQARESRQQRDELEQQQAADAEFRAKIQVEKERLQEEIDRIQQLAVGPTLPLALKNARIKQFQDKLDALEKSPDDYFVNGRLKVSHFRS